MKAPYLNNAGFSLIELLVSLGIFSLLIGSITAIFLSTNKYKDIIFEQLTTQADARKAVQDFINDVRRANYSSIGAYPLQTAGTSTIIFYSDIDGDTFRERVRYYLSNKTLYRGITRALGTPLTYTTSTEVIIPETSNVANTSSLFFYYNQNYTGTSTPLTQPVTTTVVRLVEIRMIIEKDPNKSPVPLYVQTKTEMRNLKNN